MTRPTPAQRMRYGIGDLTHAEVMRTMTLFAEQVMTVPTTTG